MNFFYIIIVEFRVVYEILGVFVLIVFDPRTQIILEGSFRTWSKIYKHRNQIRMAITAKKNALFCRKID